MAKKRKKTDAEKEEKEYRPPEFDEREFIAEEINIARAVILGAIMSIPMGLTAFFVAEALGTSFAGLIIAILGIVLIKLLMPAFKVDEVLFQIKHWFSVITTYFFSFLAIWILMVNPPFSDFAGPQIMDLEVEMIGPLDQPNMTVNSTFVEVIDNGTVTASQINVTAGLNLTVHAEITDNKELNANTVMIDFGSGPQAMVQDGSMFTYFVGVPASLPMTVTITADDTNGNNSTFEFRIA